MDHRPIFIGGVDRSGKTLMRLILDAHPNIALSRRANLWPYFYGRYGDLGREANFERCLAAVLRYKHVAHLRPDPARVRREFWEGEPTYARLFALLLMHHAEWRGKPRWGDQTGLIERYAAPIFAAHPEARLIHMLRDPRDRFEAVYARQPRGPGALGRSVAMWLYSVGMAEHNRRRHPGRYLVVRYEDLVRQPEATLRAVCTFVGEPYTPAMLSMAGPDETPEPKGPLSTDYIGRYQGRLAPRELAFFQRHAGRAMSSHGYALDPVRLSAGERLRLALIDGPGNLAAMAGWRTREAIQHRLPGRLGRRPGPKRAFAPS